MPATRITTVVVELRDDRLPGITGLGEGYPIASTVRPRDHGDGHADAARRHGRARPRPRRRRRRRPGRWRLRSAVMARPAVRSISPCTTSSARRWPSPVHVLRGLSADLPPTDFTLGIDELAVVAERATPGSRFPALKIKCGGPVRPCDAACCSGRLRRAHPGRREHGWPRAMRTRCSRSRRARVELIEQPFPARAYRDLAWFQERSAMPIVADDRASSGGSRCARGRRRRDQREAREVRWDRARAGGCSPKAARAGLQHVPRLHGGDLGRDRRSAVVASLAEWVDLDSNLLLAEDPFEGLVLGPDKRWRLSDGPALDSVWKPG